MLHKETISNKTYALLKSLMEDESFKDFFLVGGTAIALQIGHRISEDLDLFTQNDINLEYFKRHLKEKYSFVSEFENKNTLKGFINETFIDLITYDYPIIDNFVIEDNIKMLSLKDIIPMKLVAIVQSGERMKDFIDIAFLSNYYTLNEMINFYKKKYDDDNELSIYKALIYFDSIDISDKINLINKNLDFQTIEKRLIDMTKNPNTLFQPFQ